MPNTCVIKFIRGSIQTLLGGKDDTQILPQGATENRVGKDGTSGQVGSGTTPKVRWGRFGREKPKRII